MDLADVVGVAHDGAPGERVGAAETGAVSRSRRENLSDASPIVYHVDEGKITDPENRAVVESSLEELSHADYVKSVSNPYDEKNPTVSKDGKTAYATMLPDTALGDLAVAEAESIHEAAAEPAETSSKAHAPERRE